MDSPVEHTTRRIELLERKAMIAKSTIIQTRNDLRRSVDSMRTEIQDLHDDIAAFQEEMDSTIQRVRTTIMRFRGVASSKDLERIKTKADTWAPEKRITREAFVKMIEDA